MQKSKLFELLDALNGYQKNHLINFVELSSSHLNTQDKTKFKLLMKAAKSRKQLKEEKIRKTYFEKYTDSAWNKLKNKYIVVIEKYLRADLVEKNDFWGDYILLEYYHKQNAKKNFDALWNKTQSKLNKTQENNAHRNLMPYFLCEFRSRINRDYRKVSDDLQLTEQALDTFYILQKLRLSCEKTNRARLLGKPIQQTDEWLNESEFNQLDSPEIQLYCQIYNLLKYPLKEKYYKKALAIRNQHLEQLVPSIIREVSDYFFNYAVAQLNRGNYSYAAHYRNELLLLEERKVLGKNGKINIHLFGNGVLMGLVDQDFDWVARFIKDYQENILDHPDKEPIIHLNLARFYLFTNQLEACRDAIKLFKTSDHKYQLIYEKLLLKCYFLDKENPRFLEGQISRIKTKIKRLKNIREIEKKLTLTFLNTFLQLTRKKAIDFKKLKGKVGVLDYQWLVAVSK